MGKFIFITGGARSGKSSFAENMAKSHKGKILYVATGKAIDEEMEERIRLHKQQRGERFITVEGYRDIPGLLKGHIDECEVVLLDCVTIMVCNIMFDMINDWDSIDNRQSEEFEMTVAFEIQRLIEYIRVTDKTFITVTNETGMGIVPEYRSTRLYRDVSGRANQMLAKASDEAYLLVSSLPVRIK